MKTYEFTIRGLVQGVGYRPFIAELFSGLGYAGTVRNTGGIVKLELKLEDEAVESIIHRLYSNFPKGAVIEDISVKEIPHLSLSEDVRNSNNAMIADGVRKSDNAVVLDGSDKFDNTGISDINDNIGVDSFQIIESSEDDILPLLPIDIPICEECREELLDKNNRRYLYPFITCAGCGPRYTIMKKTPYDRINTTMDVYEMCDDCRREYSSCGDRRFYAQSISCPKCGPQLKLYLPEEMYSSFSLGFDENGCDLKDAASHSYSGQKHSLTDGSCDLNGLAANIYDAAVGLLRDGEVLAVKDTGGYHLVCDAFNEAAVNKVRALKKRENKPFAVMFKDVEAIKSFVDVSAAEAELLEDSARPIVLLNTVRDNPVTGMLSSPNSLDEPSPFNKVNSDTAVETDKLAPSVMLSSPYLGAMLPSNGLQVLLMEQFSALVMTSANLSGEPIIIDDEEIRALGSIAILYNDRQILTPVDDSIVRIICGKTQILRRARGFVPEPVEIKSIKNRPASACDINCSHEKKTVFATGADMKAAFGFYNSGRAYLSQGFGDFAYERVQREYNGAVRKTCDNFGFCKSEDEIICVSDCHPGYLSSRNLADTLLKNKNLSNASSVKAYHHEAHMMSVVAEQGLFDKTLISFIFDGTGYGRNSNIWGGEIFVGKPGKLDRIGHLFETPIISGDETSKNAGMSFSSFMENGELAAQIIERNSSAFDSSMYKLVRAGLKAGINITKTSSMGRLFDAVAFLLGICEYNGYEGQCPCELEYAAVRYYNSIISQAYNNQTCKDNDNDSRTCDNSTINHKNVEASGADKTMDDFLKLKLRNIYNKETNEFYADTMGFMEELAGNYLSATDCDTEKSRGRLALEFHEVIADWMLESAKLISDVQSEKCDIILGGGTFANRLLLELAVKKLTAEGFKVWFNEQVPPGDEGIPFGQLAIALEKE